MPICSNHMRQDMAREEAIRLVITAIQAAPESVPTRMTAVNFANYLISAAKKITEYVDPLPSKAGKTD